MPEHVHLLLGRRLATAETMAQQFQATSRAALVEAKCFPPTHAVWTAGQRIVYKNSPSGIITCIKYIDNNPLEIGRPKQVWDFVTPYDPSFIPF